MMYRQTLLTACITAGLGAGVAQADVTAQQVWDSWQEQAVNTGKTLTGTVEVAGNTMTIKDLLVTVKMPEIAGEKFDVRYTIGELALIEQGDGTVRLDLPDDTLLKIDLPVDADIKLDMSLAVDGDDVVISGDADNMAYDIAVAAVNMDMKISDPAMAEAVLGAAFSQKDLTGKLEVAKKEGDIQMTWAQEGGVLSVIARLDELEDGDVAVAKMEFAGFSVTSTHTLPKMAENGSMPALLKAGLQGKADYRIGAGTINVDVTEQGVKIFDYDMALQGVDFKGDLQPQGVSYDVIKKGLDVQVSSPNIPFPQVATKLSELQFGATMPMGITDEPADIGLKIGLVDLELDEQIWSLFDPAAALPRDPATLVVDLSGKARMLVDMFDPAKSEEVMMGVMMGGEKPGELYALDLNELTLKVAGAALAGKGAFTFDNEDLETFGGMPAPSGSVELTIDGANGLMDKLVQIGLLPEEQVMGVRMMSGMFARPGEGEDQLISEITVQADGQILANGQRIK